MKIEDIKVNGFYRAISNHQVVVCTGVFSNHGVFFGHIVSEGEGPLNPDETRGSSGLWTPKDYEPFDTILPLTLDELRKGKYYKLNSAVLEEGNTYSIQDGCEIVVTEDNMITIVNSIKYYINDEQHKTMALKVSKNNTLTVDIYNDNKAFIGRYKRNKDKDPAIPRSAREIDEK